MDEWSMTTDLLDLVRSYRRAARQIVRDGHLSVPQRLIAATRLASKARSEDDPLGWCARAVAEEALPFIRGEPNAPPASDPVEARHIGLRSQGYQRCPTCMDSLIDDREIQRRRSIRDAAIEQYLAREGAA